MSWRPTYRSSKFRNVYGKVGSRDQCFDGIPITKNVHDSHFCAVNAKYVAVVTESAGGGSFMVLPIKQIAAPGAGRDISTQREREVCGGLWRGKSCPNILTSLKETKRGSRAKATAARDKGTPRYRMCSGVIVDSVITSVVHTETNPKHTE
uniref:DUF1899 domain-containing protein n=1 Tax=Knipowitschia caucasica TaxID=637954 RepID=A0AAV2LQX6_KNICA